MKTNLILTDNRLFIEGALNFLTVNKVCQESFALLKNQSGPFIIDFSKVTSVNSAGLALLIEWLKYANKNQKKLTFASVPQQLIKIAKVSGVDAFLKM